MQTTIILYISEISNNDIRGKLSSISYLSRNAGILLGYIVGAVLQYRLVPCVFVTFPIVFAIWFAFLPNTPQFYLQKGEMRNAEDSLRYYKGCRKENIDEAVALHYEFQRLKAIANERKTDDTITLKDICN